MGKQLFNGYLRSDLEEIISRSTFELNSLNNSNITIFGPTGFIGGWFANLINFARLEMALNIEICYVVRKQSKNYTQIPVLKKRDKVCVNDFEKKIYVAEKPTDYILNSVTPRKNEDVLEFEKSINMIRRNLHSSIFQTAKKFANKPVVVNLSSGAVYKNNFSVSIENPIEIGPWSSEVYANDKIEFEKILEQNDQEGILKACNPRLFAFAGPFLPLSSGFAIGNFMQNLFDQSEIIIKGNPSTVRSYLYPTDLIVSLLKLLINPTLTPINLGSEIPITLLELAKLICKYSLSSSTGYSSKGDGPVSIYFPSTLNARTSGYLEEKVELTESIERWIYWKNVHKNNN